MFDVESVDWGKSGSDFGFFDSGFENPGMERNVGEVGILSDVVNSIIPVTR